MHVDYLTAYALCGKVERGGITLTIFWGVFFCVCVLLLINYRCLYSPSNNDNALGLVAMATEQVLSRRQETINHGSNQLDLPVD